MPGLAGKADLTLVYEGVNAAFKRGLNNQNRSQFGVDLENRPVSLSDVAIINGSSSSAELVPLLKSTTKMREWIGERLVHALGALRLRVVNRKFEATVGIAVDDVNDGASLGLQMAAVETMGEESMALWIDLLVDAMVANGNWADDAAFFGTAREFAAGKTIVNKTTSALSAGEFETAWRLMSSYIGHNGKAMGISPSLLVVGPKLRSTAHSIAKSVKIETGSNGATIDNPNAGLVNVVMCNRLIDAYDDYWFLLDTRSALKPFLVQKREESGIVAKTALADDNVFWQDELVWGCKSRGEAALILPQLAYAGIL